MTRSRLMLTLSVCVAFVYLAFFTPTSSADIPRLINYQGKVTDSGGNPVTDGNYPMRFRIYDDATSGTMEWDSGNRTIAVSGGVFNVLLGESPQPTITLPFDEDYWLLVTVAGDDQAPRQRLGSVGYAYMASGVVPGTEISGAVTSSPNAALKAVNTASGGTAYGIYGETTGTTGNLYGVYGRSMSTTGRGVVGVGAAVSGFSYGVLGNTYSVVGRGVFGQATATTGENYGVYGRSVSPEGYGVYGENAAASGDGYGVFGNSVASSGKAVYGAASGSSGAGIWGEATHTTGSNYGVIGASSSTGGKGVYGYVTANSGLSYGVHGLTSSPSGRGVFGQALTGSGNAYGVYGTTLSSTGHGVYGQTEIPQGISYGVRGTNVSSDGYGVYGEATATTGTNYGVFGTSASTVGYGVCGNATATSGNNYGVYGVSASSMGFGVYGVASATTGSNCGVYGSTSSGAGYAAYFDGLTRVTGDMIIDGSLTASGIGDITAVYAGSGLDGGGTSGPVTLSVEAPLSLTASATAYAGVIEGTNTTLGNGVGVFGEATGTTNTNYGVYGKSASPYGAGVYGWASATTDSPYGVYGHTSSATGYGVYYSGGLAGTGTKSCIVRTSQGPTLMYCQESPENWFEDFGLGQLTNGRAHVELDPLFLETVTIDDQNPMHVFIQPKGRCQGTFVETGRTGFEVVEQGDGTSDIAFSYRVVAKRKGFEAKRLDYYKAAETDSYLYPELREKELPELQE